MRRKPPACRGGDPTDARADSSASSYRGRQLALYVTVSVLRSIGRGGRKVNDPAECLDVGFVGEQHRDAGRTREIRMRWRERQCVMRQRSFGRADARRGGVAVRSHRPAPDHGGGLRAAAGAARRAENAEAGRPGWLRVARARGAIGDHVRKRTSGSSLVPEQPSATRCPVRICFRIVSGSAGISVVR
jgi:hypothetical protein